MKNIYNFWVNVGVHGYLLIMLSIPALLLFGFITCCMGLPSKDFYWFLGTGLALAFMLSAYCLKCNCSSFHKENKE